MGFRFKKSFNIGKHFKINLSKSGIGYSFGVKGFRIGKTAKGNDGVTVVLLDFTNIIDRFSFPHNSSQNRLESMVAYLITLL